MLGLVTGLVPGVSAEATQIGALFTKIGFWCIINTISPKPCAETRNPYSISAYSCLEGFPGSADELGSMLLLGSILAQHIRIDNFRRKTVRARNCETSGCKTSSGFTFSDVQCHARISRFRFSWKGTSFGCSTLSQSNFNLHPAISIRFIRQSSVYSPSLFVVQVLLSLFMPPWKGPLRGGIRV